MDKGYSLINKGNKFNNEADEAVLLFSWILILKKSQTFEKICNFSDKIISYTKIMIFLPVETFRDSQVAQW